MKKPTAFLLLGLLAGSPSVLHGQDADNGSDDPVLTGYVTRAASGSDFDVNGIHILCGGVVRGAIVTSQGTRQSAAGCRGDAPFIGERLEIYGVENRTLHSVAIDKSIPGGRVTSISATRIESLPMRPYGISGSAVIDTAPVRGRSGARSSSLLLRADGYQIRITGKTKIEWTPPLKSLADVKAGDWIKYKGKLDAAGAAVATFLRIGPNTIGNGEEKMRSKNEYDPSAVPASAKQSFLKDGVTGGCRGTYVMGCDPTRFPQFNDDAMQARIEKIGSSLVPTFQRTLPDSDPAKIVFRFHVIDTKLIRGALALPNGIILIPHQTVERLQNDAQVAAVLADGIARALERQQYRNDGRVKAAYATMIASSFVPNGGLGVSTGGTVASDIETGEMQQRCRVSLALLHHAGFDIDQAPMAWWLLDPGKPKPLSEIDLPDQAAYFYFVLGEIWHNPEAGGAQAH